MGAGKWPRLGVDQIKVDGFVDYPMERANRRGLEAASRVRRHGPLGLTDSQF